MTAEEFLTENDIDINTFIKLKELPEAVIGRSIKLSVLLDIYHKAKVESISDEDIFIEGQKYSPVETGMEGTYEEGKLIGFEFGADWFKEKLLK